MAAVDPKGNETYWIEGVPFQGIRVQTTKTGNQTYYLNGETAPELFPYNNQDTGKFFFLFD
jgi:hypothetical protein